MPRKLTRAFSKDHCGAQPWVCGKVRADLFSLITAAPVKGFQQLPKLAAAELKEKACRTYHPGEAVDGVCGWTCVCASVQVFFVCRLIVCVCVDAFFYMSYVGS